MKILALDSSGLVASAAILEDDILLGEYTTNFHKNHSATLLPMVDQLFGMLDLDIAECALDAIALAKGPGSFTGLRIGAATAKGLALALDIPLVGISTLEGLAYNLWQDQGLVCPIMDARREQVYTAVYYCGECIKEPCAVDISGILNILGELAAEKKTHVTFLGDGVPVFAERIAEECAPEYRFAPAHLSRQRAAAVGALAIKKAVQDENVMISADAFAPEYLRLSQAERERLAAGRSI